MQGMNSKGNLQARPNQQPTNISPNFDLNSIFQANSRHSQRHSMNEDSVFMPSVRSELSGGQPRCRKANPKEYHVRVNKQYFGQRGTVERPKVMVSKEKLPTTVIKPKEIQLETLPDRPDRQLFYRNTMNALKSLNTSKMTISNPIKSHTSSRPESRELKKIQPFELKIKTMQIKNHTNKSLNDSKKGKQPAPVKKTKFESVRNSQKMDELASAGLKLSSQLFASPQQKPNLKNKQILFKDMALTSNKRPSQQQLKSTSGRNQLQLQTIDLAQLVNSDDKFINTLSTCRSNWESIENHNLEDPDSQRARRLQFNRYVQGPKPAT